MRTVFPYEQAEYEEVPCNLCGGTDVEPFCRRDRNGLRVRSVICRECGLMFISPRMTRAWYSRYYEGEYRRQMAEYRGLATATNRKSNDRYFKEYQYKRGLWIAGYLRRQGVERIGSVLDIGSAAGGLLKALGDEFRAEVLGVEPSAADAEYARSQGVPTVAGFFEDFDPPGGRRFDLVLCTQSFNHLLDPRGVTAKVRECLTPEGVFYLECMDFFEVCEYRDSVREAVQIDHVYMWVPATLEALVETCGFRVVRESVLVDRFQSTEALAVQKKWRMPVHHVRFLARPAEPARVVRSSYEEVAAELARMPNRTLAAFLQGHWRRWRLGREARRKRRSRV